MLSGAFSCFPCTKKAVVEPEVIELAPVPKPEATTSNENHILEEEEHENNILEEEEEEEIENEINDVYTSERFPDVLKLQIIEEMDLKTRSSYMKLSRQTFLQVLDSKDYIEKLTIEREEKAVTILIGNSSSTCSIYVTDAENEYVVKYDILNDTLFRPWIEKNVFDSIAQGTQYYFGILTHFKMHNSLTRLEIDMNDFPYNTTDIRSLRQLNHLDLAVTTNDTNPIDSNFVTFEQLCRIKDCIGFHWPSLTIDKLFDLRAKNIYLYNITWDSTDFRKILLRCLRGDISKNVDIIQFNLTENTIVEHEKIVETLHPYSKKSSITGVEYLFRFLFASEDVRFRYMSIDISPREIVITPKMLIEDQLTPRRRSHGGPRFYF